MSVNSLSRFNPWKVNPISRSDGSPSRDDRLPRHTPKKEVRPVCRRVTDIKEGVVSQPSMVGVFLDRWA